MPTVFPLILAMNFLVHWNLLKEVQTLHVEDITTWGIATITNTSIIANKLNVLCSIFRDVNKRRRFIKAKPASNKLSTTFMYWFLYMA